MYILNEQQIKEFYTMHDAIDDVKALLRSKAASHIAAPMRTVIDFPKHDASILYMPSADLEQQYAAIKTVSIFPNNPQSGKATTQGVILLTNSADGEHLALLNASYLTRLRTGAISAIATDALAKQSASVLTVIGTGGMAFEQVLGVLAVRSIETIYLYNRTIQKAYQFKEKLLAFDASLQIEIADNVNDAVSKAHIINCATRSTVAVFDGAFVQEGTHINGVGSYLPSMREIDESLIVPTNKIVADDLHGVMEEAGEFIAAVANRQWHFNQLHGTVEQLVTAQIAGRVNDHEITIFKSVGAAYYDLAVAKGVYTKALAQNKGLQVTI